ncbi:MAG: hydantoinase B/oxoprolinase family protein [Woeseiaceae bacterium]
MNHQTVALQVMWNRLISIVEEQAQTLIRTAFSTSVREAGDLSAGVYDRDGRMMAQAVTGTPGHVNSMAEAVRHFINEIGREQIAEGDVYLTNDPWKGTGHLHDITVVTPSFLNGQHVGFFACTAHVVDIGGRGFNADAHSVYEEGLYIPIMRLADRGKVDQPFLTLMRANVREPDQLIGDVFALVTCNEVGHQRLVEMMHEFSLATLQDVAAFIFERSRVATIEKIKALPRQSASASMTVDGYDTPITLQVSVTTEPERMVCDFAGSSGIDKNGINVPLVYTQAYACYALKCAVAPDVPNNFASLAPFVTVAPEHTIVNAIHPAPVALRHVIGHMIPDTIYGALDQIVSDTVPAEGAGTICNFQMSLRSVSGHADARRAEVLTFNSGGGGARPTLDGMNATAFPSGVMTMPIEATEHSGPVIIWRKELRPDSGGVGRQRGGLGQCMEVGPAKGYECDFSAMLDRLHHPARGRRGGGDGAPTTICLDDGTPMQGKGKQFVADGRKVIMAFPGGGGFGDVADRDQQLILRDLRRGYLTRESAIKDYGLSAEAVDALLRSNDNEGVVDE